MTKVLLFTGLIFYAGFSHGAPITQFTQETVRQTVKQAFADFLSQSRRLKDETHENAAIENLILRAQYHAAITDVDFVPLMMRFSGATRHTGFCTFKRITLSETHLQMVSERFPDETLQALLIHEFFCASSILDTNYALSSLVVRFIHTDHADQSSRELLLAAIEAYSATYQYMMTPRRTSPIDSIDYANGLLPFGHSEASMGLSLAGGTVVGGGGDFSMAALKLKILERSLLLSRELCRRNCHLSIAQIADLPIEFSSSEDAIRSFFDKDGQVWRILIPTRLTSEAVLDQLEFGFVQPILKANQ